MTIAMANPGLSVERTWKSWLFNPFRFVAGFKALLTGIAFIIVASLLGRMGNIHFDGVLDAHFGRAWPAWAFIAEGIIDWLSLALVLAIFAAIMWPATSRFIDVVGTQALARWPSLLLVGLLQIPAYGRVLNDVSAQARQGGGVPTLSPADMIILVGISLCLLPVLVWIVALMYRAFAVSCNAKGAKAVIVFIVAIVLGEVISKTAIFQFARFIS
jgi:hypothetical protein